MTYLNFSLIISNYNITIFIVLVCVIFITWFIQYYDNQKNKTLVEFQKLFKECCNISCAEDYIICSNKVKNFEQNMPKNIENKIYIITLIFKLEEKSKDILNNKI